MTRKKHDKHYDEEPYRPPVYDPPPRMMLPVFKAPELQAVADQSPFDPPPPPGLRA